MNTINAWNTYKENDIIKVNDLCDNYRKFLDKGKTERECITEIISIAKEYGYVKLSDLIKDNKKLKTGDKVYETCMDKTIALFNIGSADIEEGLNILGAHVDSPRIDIKQNPLYEKDEFAYLDTHYYGGIKKYQWVALPLAIHGVVIKKDGSKITISIGEDKNDPVFCITDLLIHLAAEQMDKKATKVVEGENLDVLFGSIPLEEDEKTPVKANILKLIKEQYDFEEDDFFSAELELVPAGAARESGFDRSMIMAYGQDDRVCSYTSLIAMLETTDITKTSCCLLTDKEEIGSVGATGMHSKFFENTLAEIITAMGEYSDLKLRRCLSSSSMLSSDVHAAFDPLYAAAFDKKNAACFGKGVTFSKFTGSRGKSGSNDAPAEYIARLRKMLDDGNICYQTAELGKVDLGGGGTIAYILSNYGMEVIDCGVPVLNMHAPWEVTSKADIYETYKCYKVFLKEA